MSFYDSDLNPVIENASNEDLKPLRDYMLKGWTNYIEIDERYKNDPDNCVAYADLIADEFRAFGGNSIMNIMRATVMPIPPVINSIMNFMRGGEGVSYREVVCDVAKKLKVNFNNNSSVERIEECIIMKVFEEAWKKMSEEEREAAVKEIKPNAAINGGVVAMGGGRH